MINAIIHWLGFGLCKLAQKNKKNAPAQLTIAKKDWCDQRKIGCILKPVNTCVWYLRTKATFISGLTCIVTGTTLTLCLIVNIPFPMPNMNRWNLLNGFENEVPHTGFLHRSILQNSKCKTSSLEWFTRYDCALWKINNNQPIENQTLFFVQLNYATVCYVLSLSCHKADDFLKWLNTKCLHGIANGTKHVCRKPFESIQFTVLKFDLSTIHTFFFFNFQHWSLVSVVFFHFEIDCRCHQWAVNIIKSDFLLSSLCLVLLVSQANGRGHSFSICLFAFFIRKWTHF